jgi:hypothetical protein
MGYVCKYHKQTTSYTESDSKIGIWHCGNLKKLGGSSFFKRSSALNLCQAHPVLKAKGVSKNASFLGRGCCS